ncbi:aminoglycoside phosphotransferase family protein [Qipengyuania sp. DSG2-2]|uniref:aminoglycoside phosphotransferase family protein n=1 Tax=Qipengyuania sp. DGS2-2 TaxID=3349631 RepID=UPI0036D380DF
MSDLPDGLEQFLGAAGWAGADIAPLAGDASFRRYFRIARGNDRAMLMFAPPPEEDPAPFLHVAHWLSENDQRGPQIIAEDAAAGWVLTEDFGDDRMRDWLDDNPAGEEQAYAAAIDALVDLHRRPAGPFEPYDMATYLREARLLTEWYCPAAGLDVDANGFDAAWEEALAPLVARQQPGVTVLRDYHAENIMLLEPAPDGSGAQGLIDFQDALVGHPAYDLVSLLQDARREVSTDLEARMLDRYLQASGADGNFHADYALLGAQRNAKIVGIFTRLHRRDGKPRYLDFIPRVWTAMERDLAHPALAPVARWFDANIPQELRNAAGGTIA